MGKASKWFRSLLSSRKSPPDSSSAEAPPLAKEEKKKSKWACSKSTDNKFKNEEPLESPYVEGLDANKHAIAVAAATAAVAEAALAAAQAAAEVVRLTSGGGGGGRIATAYISSERRRVAAAIKIQCAFRAYLARRALRALKGLVKLQALVRGHIVRKQSADMLRRMQAMARIQARASANRSESSNSNVKFSNSHHPGVVHFRDYDHRSNNVAKRNESLLKQMQKYDSRSQISKSSNWLDHWMEQYPWNNLHHTSTDPGRVDDEKTDRILEIDTWKPRQATIRQTEKTLPTSHYFSAWNDVGQEYSKRGSGSRLSAKLQKPNPSISSEEVSSVITTNFPPDGEHVAVWTAENSPRVHSASSRAISNLRGPFRSDCSRSLFGDYLGYPNYMANTESSRARLRSQSAPKQRMQMEELGTSSTFGRGFWESDASSEKGFALLPNYRSSLKSQGTPARRVPNGFSSTYGHIF